MTLKVEEANLKHTDRFRKNLDKLLSDAEESLGKVKERSVLQTLDYFKVEDERKPKVKNLLDECHAVVSHTFDACLKINEHVTWLMEKHRKRVTNATADYNMNLMVTIENNDKSISSTKDSLSAMAQTAKTQLGSMKAEINKLKTFIAKEFDQLEQDIKSTLSKDAAEFVRLETVMTNLMSSFKTMAEHLDTNDSCFEERQQQYKTQYQQKIADMQRSLQELLTDTDEYVDGSAKSQKELVEKLSASWVDNDTMLAEEMKALQVAKAVPQETVSKLNHYRERNVTSHQNHLTHLHEKVEERIQSTRQLDKKVSSLVTTQKEMLQEHLTSVKGHNETINGILKEFLDDANPCYTLPQTYESSKGALHKLLSNVADTENLLLSELHMSVDNQSDQLSEGLDEAASEIRKISGFQNEFWDVNYLKDLPTGATPMKREYQYPTKLSATSPHERVLSRYRLVSKDIQETLLECDLAVSDSSADPGDEDRTEEVEARLKREREDYNRAEMEYHAETMELEVQKQLQLGLNEKAKSESDKAMPLSDAAQVRGKLKQRSETDEPFQGRLTLLADVLQSKFDKGMSLKDVLDEFREMTKPGPNPGCSLRASSPDTDGEKENAGPATHTVPEPSSKKNRRNSNSNKKKARK
ncbi:Kinesin-like protein KIF11 [Orchesella cincta]|uniref:Kinesin-like protein KIF11 n=1 Tax=Orchesella cincta TaxID=48709 RepID=A0A1D2N0M9_ORCCI|nr:Kinesin-like protein KIF11 [Orchesella cincta]